MSFNNVSLLSGRGSDVQYEVNYTGDINFLWGETNFKITASELKDVLDNFFKDEHKWYELGASMAPIKENGLGEYINRVTNYRLTPRHASAVAACLVNENILTFKGIKPIYLKKL